MDPKFLMANRSWLTRADTKQNQPTYVSSRLRIALLTEAVRTASLFYSDFFGATFDDSTLADLVSQYKNDYTNALAHRLFVSGGIGEADHLNLWCLSHIYSPELYAESGVFVGGSLHAFINSNSLSKVIAIDPRIENLRISLEGVNGVMLVNDRDFSQIDFAVSGAKSIVYFDDHIDSASRIIQAQQKGFRYVVFDDSTGIQGICQRMFPAIPTVPMIMQADLLSPGDELSWTFRRDSPSCFSRFVRKAFARAQGVRVTLSATEELVESCYAARKLIKRCTRLPNLDDFIPQSRPEPTVMNEKYLLELDNDL